ncbi:endonuclease III [Gallibacter intestinalis]|uniref:Endonuclease III n=1 Tax=Gallibacter intestinalis TaxID=2779356 RepID=A0ABR9QXE1_9FIRM|nr:endonuclease III [Gallibacter intestinalis]
MKKEKVNEILDLLEKEYPDAECALDYDSVFHLLLAVVLSAQTTDVSVNKVTPELFKKYETPKQLAQADEKEVAEIIRTIGMYRTKSKNIINLAKMLVEKYDGIVPESDEELVKLPGVGRKTANVVMAVGFGHQRIAVDTHVFRVSNRIGLVNEPDVLKTELALMKTIPENRWTKTHHSLIFHGRRCCTARNPKCDECVIKNLCKKKC